MLTEVGGLLKARLKASLEARTWRCLSLTQLCSGLSSCLPGWPTYNLQKHPAHRGPSVEGLKAQVRMRRTARVEHPQLLAHGHPLKKSLTTDGVQKVLHCPFQAPFRGKTMLLYPFMCRKNTKQSISYFMELLTDGHLDLGSLATVGC